MLCRDYNSYFNVRPLLLVSSYGIFSKTVDELELYRVKVYRVTQSFVQRLFNLGAVELITSDKTDAVVSLRLIKDPTSIKDINWYQLGSQLGTIGVKP